MARAPDPNLDLLIRVAEALGELRSRFVFVGGCATGLLITDPAAPAARPTRDVDVIVEVAALAEYRELGRELQAKGFSQPLAAGDPPYRWTGRDGSKLDVMPTEERILGFSNRWYREAIRTARENELRAGLSIRLVTAPYFLATKHEAFLGRGRGDYLGSHDFEDLMAVIDGRPELEGEVRAAEPPLRGYLADVMRRTIADERFRSVLGGFVIESGGSLGRASELLARMERLADPAR
jgi:predicted nucleotidyltransferase